MSLPSESPNNLSVSPEFSSRRAKMLITMLGADFTKTARHPFFDRLIDLATSDTNREHDPKLNDQGLSTALQALIARLEAAEDPLTTPSNRRDIRVGETADQSAEHEATNKAKDSAQTTIDALRDQHPVVIANTAKNLTSKQKAVLLRALPGNLARHVFSILQNLE